jgi:trehalose 6-phosphate phosphatase
MPLPENQCQLTRMFKASSRCSVVWALDFDGTLVDLAPHPDAIRVPPDLVATLNVLHQPPASCALVISGRTTADLARHLTGFRGVLLGGHGADRLTVRPPAEWRAAVDAWARRFPGVWLEDKGATWCVHWRSVSESLRPALIATVDAWMAQEADRGRTAGYRARYGHMALDIVPAAANKGTALTGWLEAQFGRAWRDRVVVVAMGDDATDEDMFRVASDSPWGLAVQVGRRDPTAARFRLDSPAAAVAWIQANGPLTASR